MSFAQKDELEIKGRVFINLHIYILDMARGLRLAILAIAVAALLQLTAAQNTHTVGDDLGWVVPPGGNITYKIWAASQLFLAGDILVFNFSDGDQDVAKVTKEAFNTCNSTNPISLKTKSPANFTLDTIGEYYFIGTKDGHCKSGQKLAFNVTSAPGNTTYIVGDDFGWYIPPGGEVYYKTWAYGKIFTVGDTLVFNFVNGSDDVAVVTKSVYENCTKNDTIAVYKSTPANITLNSTGEHFFTSTYNKRCEWGQKLAINVTANGTATPPSSGSAKPPPGSSSSINGPTAAPPAQNSAPSRFPGRGYFVTSLLIAIALFH